EWGGFRAVGLETFAVWPVGDGFRRIFSSVAPAPVCQRVGLMSSKPPTTWAGARFSAMLLRVIASSPRRGLTLLSAAGLPIAAGTLPGGVDGLALTSWAPDCDTVAAIEATPRDIVTADVASVPNSTKSS